MIKHNIGVQTKNTIEIKKLDEDFLLMKDNYILSINQFEFPK